MAQVEALEVLPASPPSQERALAVAEMASLLMVSGENAAAQRAAASSSDLAPSCGRGITSASTRQCPSRSAGG